MKILKDLHYIKKTINFFMKYFYKKSNTLISLVSKNLWKKLGNSQFENLENSELLKFISTKLRMPTTTISGFI